MTKIKAPLHSLKATGPLGRDLQFSATRHGGRVGAPTTPGNPRTPAQVAHRTIFQSGVEFWHTLTDAEKEAYAALDRRTGYNPGYLNFMSLWLRGEVPYDRGEGHLPLIAWSFKTVLSGSWARLQNNIIYLAGIIYNTSASDGDEVAWPLYLSAGTYDIALVCNRVADSGIVKIDIDGVEVATFDLYNSPTQNSHYMLVTGVVVATPGLKTISARLDGKNPSSTSYLARLVALIFTRTD